MGHGRSPTLPSLSVFFSPFLKSFPFHRGTAAARPSVSGEQNEEERAERSRLTIEWKKVCFSSVLSQPSLVGQEDRLQPVHQSHTDGPSTLVKKPSPALTFLAQAAQTDRARDGKRDLKQCAFLQV